MKTVKNRRRTHQTDYGKRLKLLKSGRPRLVFRRTNKYIIAQYTVSEAARDKVVKGITSKVLLQHGWPESAKGGLKSISASYLTGYMVGKQIIKDGLETPIVDFGMIQTIHKTKVFAFIKGLIDAGLEISCKEEALPEEERIAGEHLKNKVDVSKIKSNLDKI